MKASVKLESNNTEKGNATELRACRSCLATDVKLFELSKNGLAQSFGDIMGTSVHATDGMPQHICYYCCAQLRKCATFRTRSQQAQFSFQEIRVQNLTVTTAHVRNLDRKSFEIPLTVPKVLNLDYLPDDKNEYIFETSQHTDSILKIILENPDITEIKTEENPISVFCENDEITDHLFDNDEPFIDFEDELKSDNCTVIAEEIQCDFEKPRASKRKKVTKEKVKKEFKHKEPKEKKQPKRKRPYNQKFEEDFEGFAKDYNVDVIFLTKEQQLEAVQARKEMYKMHRFICEVCFMGFYTENAHKRHVDKHDPSRGTHVCEICELRFPTRTQYLCHARIHRRQFICKLCNQVNRCASRAKLHHQWHEGLKFECPHCKKKFNAHSTKLNHIREHHTTVTCDICNESIDGTIRLAKHKTESHGVAKLVRPYYPTLKREYMDKDYVKRPYVKREKKDPQKGCITCGVLFLNDEALERHRSQENGCNTSLRPCPACGENFPMKDLEEHSRLMHNGELFKCKDCPSTFTSDRKLGIHWARSHAPRNMSGPDRPASRTPRAVPCGQIKTYMCEVCANKFATPVQLRYHQRMHSDERPYACPICPKKFRVPGNLRVHMNIHTGERPFKCRYCPETFKSYSQRHKHKLLVHTKERKYKCHMCEKTYVLSFDLKSHIQFTHMHVPRPPRNRNRNKQPPQAQ